MGGGGIGGVPLDSHENKNGQNSLEQLVGLGCKAYRVAIDGSPLDASKIPTDFGMYFLFKILRDFHGMGGCCWGKQKQDMKDFNVNGATSVFDTQWAPPAIMGLVIKLAV